MQIDPLFADDVQAVRERKEAARARDRESQTRSRNAIRAALDTELEEVLAAAAAKRRAYDDQWLEQHRAREEAGRKAERLRAEENGAGSAMVSAQPPEQQ